MKFSAIHLLLLLFSSFYAQAQDTETFPAECYVYVVLNKRGFEELNQVRKNEDHSVLKLSYLKQF